MKIRLTVLAAALVLAAPALASPPRVAARAYLVENGATGEVLLSYHARRRLPMASITKLMTVLLAVERAKPDDVVTVSRAAAKVGESTVHLRPGERLTVRDLMKAALIQSANDAADALAAHIAGSGAAFVALMNERARELGLADTHFVRPDGLDAPGHVSSARDVSLLARIVMRKPIVRTIVRERTATIGGGRTLHTWNDLLGSFPGLIGVKTGHTSGAGWSEVAAARGPGTTIYATILGSPSRSRRNADLAALLAWGLSRYRAVTVVDPHRVYASVETGFGRRAVRLVAAGPLLKVVRVGRPLTERVVAPAAVSLPVERGRRLGEVRLYAGGKLIGRRPLVAAESISRPGLGGRIGWYAGRTVHHIWGWIFS